MSRITCCFLFLSLSIPLTAAERPNILLIVSDDHGYGDVGAYGCRDIPTPHLDSLAANGVRFTSGYVSGPYCSPTRAGLMTGRYQTRFGHEFNPGPGPDADAKIGLPLSETTLPQRLKNANYKTGMVGKWHLGIGETTNLADQHPDKVQELAAAWDQWNESNVDPLWYPGQAGGRKEKRDAKKAKKKERTAN